MLKSLFARVAARCSRWVELCFARSHDATSINERYIDTAPCDQNAVNIFKGQWVSAFPASESVISGGNIGLFNDSRISWLIERIGQQIQTMEIAELGPFEAGHSYMLHKAGASKILAIEGNSLNFMKTLVAKEVFNLARLEVKYGEIETWLGQHNTRFDVMLASGVLYHFKDPLLALFNMTRLSDRIYLWTHYIDQVPIRKSDRRMDSLTGKTTKREVEGVECDYYFRNYKGVQQTKLFCGGVYNYSIWLEHATIIRALRKWGFQIEETQQQLDHPNGPASCFYAFK